MVQRVNMAEGYFRRLECAFAGLDEEPADAGAVFPRRAEAAPGAAGRREGCYWQVLR
jgi:hypothetical protein